MNKLILIAYSSLFLNACSFSDYIPDSLIPYKDDVNQGSVLSRFSINQLETGMLKTQVQELIGPPSIIDPFHNNQWDYINHSTMGSGDVVHYRLTLVFKENKLANINTDGISSLPQLSDKQKKLQSTYIAERKAQAIAERIAKAKALEEERIAKTKALEEERIAKTKALEEERIAKTKALEKERIAKTKALEKERIATDKIKTRIEAKQLEEANKYWYKFW